MDEKLYLKILIIDTTVYAKINEDSAKIVELIFQEIRNWLEYITNVVHFDILN